MLIGKRRRPDMKRTASVSRITVDLSHVEGQQPSDDQNPVTGEIPPATRDDHDMMNYTLAFVSPRGRRNPSAFNDGAGDNSSVHFLRTCSFCHRRLSPARDIFMYMGDTAFCSAECRGQKIKQDEIKEKSTARGSGSGGGDGGGSGHKQR